MENTTAMINELQTTHENHIKKLKELHETELNDLKKELNRSRQEFEEISEEKQKIETEYEGFKGEIEEMRNSFDLVQSRLKRVLVDQDDLVKLIQLIDLKDAQEEKTKQRNMNTENAMDQSIPRNISELETILKSSTSTSTDNTAATLQAIKYFKKLESSDPIKLCHLLEIPFEPDRSFSLSTSLLQNISIHMSNDPLSIKLFRKFPLYPVLLNEIVRLRQDVNGICRVFLGNTRKPSKVLVASITKRISDMRNDHSDRSSSSDVQSETILKWLIDEYAENLDNNESFSNNSTTSILSRFFSTFT